MAADRLSILQVTPQPLGSGHEIDEFVSGVSAELSRKGHRVVIAAPSESRKEVREGAIGNQDRPRSPGVAVRRRRRAAPACGRRRGAASARPTARVRRRFPLTSAGRWSGCSARSPFDIVHVHEPFAPSLSSAALRHSFSLNVGTFHDPQERVLSTQVARPLVEIFFGRLDARTVTSAVTGERLERYFAGSYQLVPRRRGLDSARRLRKQGPLRILFCLQEERGALADLPARPAQAAGRTRLAGDDLGSVPERDSPAYRPRDPRPDRRGRPGEDRPVPS